jgi:histidinol-phosphate aminotransferase
MNDHGGLRAEEALSLGLDPGAVLDLSQNLAPLPPPPSVRQAIASCDYRPYPDPTYHRLRQALGQRHGLEPEWVLPGNGASELLFLACRALLAPEDRVVVLTPTFSEYERAARASAAQVVHFWAKPEDGFRWPLKNVCRELKALRPAMVFLCCPNNPTGLYLAKEEVELIVSAMGEGVLVLDESFVDFVEGAWDSLELAKEAKVLVIRSLTKVFALAGVRLGYALGRPELLQRLRVHQPPWSVNAFAEAAGVACASEEGHVRTVRRLVTEARIAMVAELRALGLTVIEGAANFLLVEVGDAPTFRRCLLARGVCVRDCTSFALPSYVRMAVPHPQQIPLVIEAFAQAIQEIGRA